MDHVELDIKEMLELGKKTANASKIISNSVDVDAMGTGNRCVAARLHVKFLTHHSLLEIETFSHLLFPSTGPQITTSCHQKAVSFPSYTFDCDSNMNLEVLQQL